MKIWSLTISTNSPVQAFQKLIYVSTLVFGEASSFLLPWKRVFNVTDSQVLIHKFYLFLTYVVMFCITDLFIVPYSIDIYPFLPF